MRKESLRSIKSSSRGRTVDAERGFVIVVALVLAVLYFMLMALIMIDSSRAQAEAQRFRARMVASILAEDGAEAACVQMVNNPGGGPGLVRNEHGVAKGEYTRVDKNFSVAAYADTAGVIHQHAEVKLDGTVIDGHIRIDYSRHSQ